MKPEPLKDKHLIRGGYRYLYYDKDIKSAVMWLKENIDNKIKHCEDAIKHYLKRKQDRSSRDNLRHSIGGFEESKKLIDKAFEDVK